MKMRSIHLLSAFFAVPLVVYGSTSEVEVAYQNTCSACHGFGVAGAPIPGKAADWEDRLKKPLNTVYQNAIEGFTGELGTMPAKGGFTDFTDEQVKAIVDFMISDLE